MNYFIFVLSAAIVWARETSSKATCPDIIFANGKLSCSNNVAENSVCAFQCNDEYRLSGYPYSTCKRDDRTLMWVPPVPRCHDDEHLSPSYRKLLAWLGGCLLTALLLCGLAVSVSVLHSLCRSARNCCSSVDCRCQSHDVSRGNRCRTLRFCYICCFPDDSSDTEQLHPRRNSTEEDSSEYVAPRDVLASEVGGSGPSSLEQEDGFATAVAQPVVDAEGGLQSSTALTETSVHTENQSAVTDQPRSSATEHTPAADTASIESDQHQSAEVPLDASQPRDSDTNGSDEKCVNEDNKDLHQHNDPNGEEKAKVEDDNSEKSASEVIDSDNTDSTSAKNTSNQSDPAPSDVPQQGEVE